MGKENLNALSGVGGNSDRSIALRGVLAVIFDVLLTLIVMLNTPLSWFLNGTVGFYSLAWMFSGSAFHAWVAFAALVGGVLVKYIVLRRGVKRSRR